MGMFSRLREILARFSSEGGIRHLHQFLAGYARRERALSVKQMLNGSEGATPSPRHHFCAIKVIATYCTVYAESRERNPHGAPPSAGSTSIKSRGS